MKSGRLFDIADVLKSLTDIMSRKTLSFREKKMYERAKYLIVSEIAVINGLDEQVVERQVDRALFKSAQGRAAPSANSRLALARVERAASSRRDVSERRVVSAARRRRSLVSSARAASAASAAPAGGANMAAITSAVTNLSM
jgi:hypothetical protein